MKKRNSTTRGFLAIQVLIYASIAVLLISAVITWAGNSYKDSRYVTDRERAFYIAEAGIEYYRWHLAHDPLDFTDGTTTPAPYVHDYVDAGNVKIGTFSLEITPPIVGSTITTIRSTGKVTSNPLISRTIEARLAKPSLAKFAVAANDVMRFGEGTVVNGEIQSNQGIHFDGIANNIVSSAVASYDDPDHSGGVEFGVHTHVRPPPLPPPSYAGFVAAEAPPSATSSRPDVFVAGRQFPVPAINFNGFTASLADMKTDAQAAGRYHAASGGLGYLVTLRTDDTYDLARVTAVYDVNGSCKSGSGGGTNPLWSYSVTATVPLGNFAFPANGILFLEDNVWIQGQIDGARITVASGRFPETPSTNSRITINNDLLYTNYDGTDVIALVAQGSVSVGLISDDDLRIDAALLAKNSRVGRNSYSTSCTIAGIPYWHRNSITLYGMIASNLRYGFAYTGAAFNCGGGVTIGNGYCDRFLNYDANLLYGPPPSFPLASDEYETISWREI